MSIVSEYIEESLDIGKVVELEEQRFSDSITKLENGDVEIFFVINKLREMNSRLKITKNHLDNLLFCSEQKIAELILILDFDK